VTFDPHGPPPLPPPPPPSHPMQLNFFLKLHHILGNIYAKFQPWVRHMVCQLFPGCPLLSGGTADVQMTGPEHRPGIGSLRLYWRASIYVRAQAILPLHTAMLTVGLAEEAMHATRQGACSCPNIGHLAQLSSMRSTLLSTQTTCTQGIPGGSAELQVHLLGRQRLHGTGHHVRTTLMWPACHNPHSSCSCWRRAHQGTPDLKNLLALMQ
jgi:hypothetical protein